VPSQPEKDKGEVMDNKVTNPEIANMINNLMNNPHVDESTKVGFITSLKFQYDAKKYLTSGQYVALERICKNYANINEDWYKDFEGEKRENFKIVLDYYRRTNYFGNILSKVAKDAGYIPTEAEYRSICENKYAKVLIEGYRAAPKYKLGEMVRIRNQRYGYDSHGVGTVLEVMPHVNNAVRGNKIYKVYFVTSGETLEMEERHIAIVRQSDYDKMANNNDISF
jgi:hypothetical protein